MSGNKIAMQLLLVYIAILSTLISHSFQTGEFALSTESGQNLNDTTKLHLSGYSHTVSKTTMWSPNRKTRWLQYLNESNESEDPHESAIDRHVTATLTGRSPISTPPAIASIRHFKSRNIFSRTHKTTFPPQELLNHKAQGDSPPISSTATNSRKNSISRAVQLLKAKDTTNTPFIYGSTSPHSKKPSSAADFGNIQKLKNFLSSRSGKTKNNSSRVHKNHDWNGHKTKSSQPAQPGSRSGAIYGNLQFQHGSSNDGQLSNTQGPPSNNGQEFQWKGQGQNGNPNGNNEWKSDYAFPAVSPSNNRSEVGPFVPAVGRRGNTNFRTKLSDYSGTKNSSGMIMSHGQVNEKSSGTTTRSLEEGTDGENRSDNRLRDDPIALQPWERNNENPQNQVADTYDEFYNSWGGPEYTSSQEEINRRGYYDGSDYYYGPAENGNANEDSNRSNSGDNLGFQPSPGNGAWQSGQERKPDTDYITTFLTIVETQHLLGENCTPGTDLNLGEGVVDRYAQERFRLESEITVNRANMLTRFWKYSGKKVLQDEYLLNALVISLVEFDEDIFAAGNCYDGYQYKNYSLFCPYAYRLPEGKILVKDLSLEYKYLSNTSEWFYIARKNAESVIKANEQTTKGECLDLLRVVFVLSSD